MEYKKVLNIETCDIYFDTPKQAAAYFLNGLDTVCMKLHRDSAASIIHRLLGEGAVVAKAKWETEGDELWDDAYEEFILLNTLEKSGAESANKLCHPEFESDS